MMDWFSDRLHQIIDDGKTYKTEEVDGTNTLAIHHSPCGCSLSRYVGTLWHQTNTNYLQTSYIFFIKFKLLCLVDVRGILMNFIYSMIFVESWKSMKYTQLLLLLLLLLQLDSTRFTPLLMQYTTANFIDSNEPHFTHSFTQLQLLTLHLIVVRIISKSVQK